MKYFAGVSERVTPKTLAADLFQQPAGGLIWPAVPNADYDTGVAVRFESETFGWHLGDVGLAVGS